MTYIAWILRAPPATATSDLANTERVDLMSKPLQLQPIDGPIEVTPSRILSAEEMLQPDWEGELQGRGYRLFARRNRKGDHVVCALRDCGERLAKIDPYWSFLTIASGYAPDRRYHGVWTLSNRARRRGAKGGSRLFRRYPINDGVVSNTVLTEDYSSLPVGVRCGSCGYGNLIVERFAGVAKVKVTLAPD